MPSSSLPPRMSPTSVRELNALEVAAQSPTGTAAQTTSTVLPLQLTAQPSPESMPSSSLPPRISPNSVRELNALEVAALSPTGTAAQTTSTVLPQLLIALPKNSSKCLA